MNILLVADGRSPNTRSWVKALVSLGHQLTLISTYPSAPIEGVEADLCMPVAFSSMAGSGAGVGAVPVQGQQRAGRKILSSFRSVFMAGRYHLGPITLKYYGPRYRWLVSRMKPDLVHALRIPFEGMLAAYTPPGIPLAVSIWGNDLTLHAGGSGAMSALTRRVLARADALLADASRDVRLAQTWGFASQKPALVVPGSGGIDLVEIEQVRQAYSPQQVESLVSGLAPGAPLVINPRGFRTGSVRNDTFFAAIPLVLERHPEVTFACAAMAGQTEALRQVARLGLERKVCLLPLLSQTDLWSIFLRASLTVSISQHDGTPNSLLEAFALGCFPVAGDIESIREWITPGVNGLLVEPDKPSALAEAILTALDNPTLRRAAAEKNACLVKDRAEASLVRDRIEQLYQQMTGNTPSESE